MDDALAYSKEVYAACLTIGFAGGEVARLKRLIDACEDGIDPGANGTADLLVLAQRAHLAAAR